jgi:hypothetical protein
VLVRSDLLKPIIGGAQGILDVAGRTLVRLRSSRRSTTTT